MRWQIPVFMSAVLFAAEPAWALRCGTKLIGAGAPQSKVLRYCGEPEAVLARRIYRTGFPGRNASDWPRNHELRYTDRAYVEILVEEWTYNFGPRRLMRVIRFENGIVTEITRLGYGYH